MTMIEQGTDAWRQQRVGKVTASRIADIMAKTKTGVSASRGNYLAELLVERLTGIPTVGFVSSAMQWGTDNEADARGTYEFFRDCEVEPAGFVDHPTIPMAGASPDGFVGADGLVEIKCPLTATHVETLQGGSIPGKYIGQIQFQLACTGRTWCDWASFDPRMPPAMRLFVQRVQRDERAIGEIERQIVAFLAELDAKVADLKKQYMTTPAERSAELVNLLQAG